MREVHPSLIIRTDPAFPRHNSPIPLMQNALPRNWTGFLPVFPNDPPLYLCESDDRAEIQLIKDIQDCCANLPSILQSRIMSSLILGIHNLNHYGIGFADTMRVSRLTFTESLNISTFRSTLIDYFLASVSAPASSYTQGLHIPSALNSIESWLSRYGGRLPVKAQAAENRQLIHKMLTERVSVINASVQETAVEILSTTNKLQRIPRDDVIQRYRVYKQDLCPVCLLYNCFIHERYSVLDIEPSSVTEYRQFYLDDTNVHDEDDVFSYKNCECVFPMPVYADELPSHPHESSNGDDMYSIANINLHIESDHVMYNKRLASYLGTRRVYPRDLPEILSYYRKSHLPIPDLNLGSKCSNINPEACIAQAPHPHITNPYTVPRSMHFKKPGSLLANQGHAVHIGAADSALASSAHSQHHKDGELSAVLSVLHANYSTLASLRSFTVHDVDVKTCNRWPSCSLREQALIGLLLRGSDGNIPLVASMLAMDPRDIMFIGMLTKVFHTSDLKPEYTDPLQGPPIYSREYLKYRATLFEDMHAVFSSDKLRNKIIVENNQLMSSFPYSSFIEIADPKQPKIRPTGKHLVLERKKFIPLVKASCRLTNSAIDSLHDDENLLYVEGIEHSYFPSGCYHPGLPCHYMWCTCLQQRVPCGEHCGCYGYQKPCKYYFMGCCDNDPYTGCVGHNQCLCQRNNMVCKPDTCSCMIHAAEALNAGILGNTSLCLLSLIGLRLYKPIRVAITRSDIHGFGLRALNTRHHVAKDTPIIEYAGDLVSSDESERRGRMADALHMTYLFTIRPPNYKDSEYPEVDAGMRGNEARYANHSNNATVSCRTLSYCGEQRAIFRTLGSHIRQEITFNYHFKTANNKHDHGINK